MTTEEKTERRLPAIRRMTEQCGILIDRVEFIPGGKTNESYIVYGKDGEKYLARIAGEGTEHYIDRKKEAHNINVANRIGVSPKLFCADHYNLLLQYIDGTCTTSQNILFLNDNLQKITEQFRILHDSSEQFEGKFSFIEDFEIYKAEFFRTGTPVPREMKENEEELYRLTQWVDDHYSDDVCPVHSDVVLQNFIFTEERAYMVDWEYSTMADRYLELASFCTQNILASGVEKLFLKQYFSGHEPDFDMGKFLLYKMAISFRWIYWHLNNVAHDKDPEYNEYRWRMHLNNAVMCKEEWETLRRKPSISG